AHSGGFPPRNAPGRLIRVQRGLRLIVELEPGSFGRRVRFDDPAQNRGRLNQPIFPMIEETASSFFWIEEARVSAWLKALISRWISKLPSRPWSSRAFIAGVDYAPSIGPAKRSGCDHACHAAMNWATSRQASVRTRSPRAAGNGWLGR